MCQIYLQLKECSGNVITSYNGYKKKDLNQFLLKLEITKTCKILGDNGKDFIIKNIN